ncbi:MAG: HEPN domain-containing protein [Deltaproteobacteria bacterium]|nr:HEPN domain-containing protein [Deltaproteobacteria bacterium]
MTNHAAAKEVLAYARSVLLSEMLRARGTGIHARVVRLAQETTELVLKAGIRQLGADYPKVHDPAAAFVTVALAAGATLSTAEIRRLLEDSKWLADQRGAAGYLERPFDESEATRAADSAAWTLTLVEERVFGPGRPAS